MELNNIAIVSGTITSIGASSSKTANINYPAGYDYDNCVPVALGLNGVDNKGYNYFGTYKDSGDVLTSAYKRRLNLTSSNMILTVYNPNSSQLNVKYKIVLMKIGD